MRFADEEIVEIAAVISHFSGLNTFEETYRQKEELIKPLVENEVEQSNEIEQTLGLLPHYYRIMAKDPENLQIIWNRE